jgi:hypothetical protein
MAATLTEAILANDADRVAELVSDWDDIDQPLKYEDGKIGPLLFGAIYAGADRVTALLLGRGANPELGLESFSARSCAEGAAENAAVQQIVAARAFYIADYAVVCAPNGFTKSAKELAMRTEVVLLSPAALASLEVAASLLS